LETASDVNPSFKAFHVCGDRNHEFPNTLQRFGSTVSGRRFIFYFIEGWRLFL